MTATLDFNSTVMATAYRSAPAEVNPIAAVVSAFEALPISDRLAILWRIYQAAPESERWGETRSARLTLIAGLLHKIQNLPAQEQMNVLLDLVNHSDTEFSRAYGLLSVKTRLICWHQFAQSLTQGYVAASLMHRKLTTAGQQVLAWIHRLDPEQQHMVLRDVIVHLGVDALAS